MTWEFLAGQFAQQFGLWWVIWPAILLGIVVGILPGFSPQNTLIMLLPLTLAVPVEQALAFMIALYCANHLAGGIPAILVRIPGSGGAAATTLDGYPMTKKGQAQQALVLCFTASVFGGLITTLATLALLPWLSKMGLYLRSVEMVVVMLFGLTLIAVIAAKDFLKGMIAGFFRGWVDTTIARLIDILLAFPVLLLGLGLATACSGKDGCVGGHERLFSGQEF